MHLDLALYDGEVSGLGDPSVRSLYPHFLSWMEEVAVAGYLEQCHCPMSKAEIEYFGLSQEG